MLPPDRAEKETAGNAARGQVAAHDAAHVLDALHAALKAAGDQAARVLAHDAARLHGGAGGADGAQHPEGVDLRLGSGAAKKAHAGARGRHLQAPDAVAVAQKAARKVRYRFKVRAREVQVLRQFEHPAERVALLGAAPGEGEKVLHGGDDLRLLPLGQSGRRRRGKQHQQRQAKCRHAFHPSSPPRKSMWNLVLSTALSSSTSSWGSTVSTSTTEMKAPRPTASPMWLTYTSLTR